MLTLPLETGAIGELQNVIQSLTLVCVHRVEFGLGVVASEGNGVTGTDAGDVGNLIVRQGSGFQQIRLTDQITKILDIDNLGDGFCGLTPLKGYAETGKCDRSFLLVITFVPPDETPGGFSLFSAYFGNMTGLNRQRICRRPDAIPFSNELVIDGELYHRNALSLRNASLGFL